MGQKRATTREEKARRRREIMSTAQAAFDAYGYDTVSMAYLAEKTGLAKGTLYLYFPTKEALFLSLCEEELDAWLAAVRKVLGDGDSPMGDLAITGILLDPLISRPRLFSLLALAHVVLERNIDFERARLYRAKLLKQFNAVGRELERRVAQFKPGDGALFMLRCYGTVIGLGQVGKPSPIVARVVAGREYELFRRDLYEELGNVLVMMLAGWRSGVAWH